MRWNNKGHENDALGNRLVEDFLKSSKVFIFGAGKLGRYDKKMLDWYGIDNCFIDNDPRKIQDSIDGNEVISLKNYLMDEQKGWIVISVAPENELIIEGQLIDLGLKKNTDYFFRNEFLKKFFPVFSVYYTGKVYMDMIQVSLTEKCSLKCKDCAHGCWNVSNTVADLEIDNVINSIDILFSKVGYIGELALIGGEPLLASFLPELIRFIGNRYRERIGILSITTNGTIMPNDSLLNACRDSEVFFRISNYSLQINRLSDKYKLLKDLLEKYDIDFRLQSPEYEWFDYAFGKVDYGEDKDVLSNHFDRCGTMCKEVRDGKLYSCIMGRSVSENLFNRFDEFYLDLKENLNPKEIMEYYLGYSKEGYMKTCRFCRGADAINYRIPAAIQKE